MAERLALPTLDHMVSSSNPAVGKILNNPSCSPFHHPDMTEILLKGDILLKGTENTKTIFFMFKQFQLSLG